MCEQVAREGNMQVAFCTTHLSDPFLICVRKYQF